MKIKSKQTMSRVLFFLILFQVTSAVAGELIQQNNLQYLGAFTVPWTRQGCDSWTDCVFGYGGQLLTFNPQGNAGKGSFYLGGNVQAQNVAEVNVPTLLNNLTDRNLLNNATLLQNFFDPTEGNQKNILTGGAPYGETVYKGGLLVYGGKLIGTVYTYYPGNTQILSHYTHSLNLSEKGTFKGMYQVGSIPARMLGGYMAHIPATWQTALGGTVLTGQAAIPVISTTSSGPSASAFNPAELGVKNPVPSFPLVYYPITNPLAKPDTANPYFTVSSSIRGLVFPEGSDSVLFFGSNGTGAYCYGEQTLDPALDRQPVPGNPGDMYCYDPANSYKGPHMYPYKYQVWAYDAKDLALSKERVVLSPLNRTPNIDPYCANGTEIKPWCVKPYAVWNFSLPFQPMNAELLGATYDPLTQRIYLSQNVDSFPVIHAFYINIGPSTIVPKSPTNLKGTIVK